ncbi:MAG: acyl-CoA/acyl-ACP dehydrogenase [Chloroflexi bacterium]|nr:acyl-CoA/acyl-ACP dehydrogenase [Chloroflexota bacterium]
MDLGLSESQQMLKNSAREFLERECPTSFVRATEKDERGYSPELWAKMAELGWLGLMVPEEHGGMGAGFVDLAVLLEEMGRALLPGPFLPTVVLGGLPLAEFGTAEQKRDLLPKIAQGQIICTAAIAEPSATFEASGIQLQAQARAGEYVLNGTKLFVPDAHVSDYLLVAARTGTGGGPEEGVTVFIVPGDARGLKRRVLKTIASDRQCEVALENVAVPRNSVLGQVDGGWAIVERMRDWAAVALCAQLVGNMDRVLEMTVEYAKQRVQFGRPIGSFQAIQHHCADMATDVEGSRYIMYQAAWKLAQGDKAGLEVAMAKAWCSAASARVSSLAHQSHGAIGFTMEHDLQLFTRRAKAWELSFGDPDFHRELVAQEMGA